MNEILSVLDLHDPALKPSHPPLPDTSLQRSCIDATACVSFADHVGRGPSEKFSMLVPGV